MRENSKTFKRIGSLVGINAERKTQRGIIARKFLKQVEKEELRRFGEQFKRIELNDGIKFYENGVFRGYL